jgi:putative phosphoribosyl transferase
MFDDRVDAGRQLGATLAASPVVTASSRVVVLGLPRGGVPVAYEVARALGTPLDVILVRKLGVPVQPELAMGAIGEDGVRVVNDDIMRAARVTAADFDDVEARERAELARRSQFVRARAPRLPIDGVTAIIVDDGIATGSTARAACQVARAHGAARVVLAAPVAPASALHGLRDAADLVVVVDAPAHFRAIGQFYRDFSPTSEETVGELLTRARS